MSERTVSLSGQKVLITGASGFIGSRLMERLEAVDCEIHAVSRAERRAESRSIRWWKCDLAEASAVNRIVGAVKPDTILHLASLVAGARDRSLVAPMLRSNLLSSVNLLNAAADVDARIVLAGSMEEPGDETADRAPCSPYAAAKWAASGYARMFHALYELSVVTLRIFMVYGPGRQDEKKLVPCVLRSLLRGQSPALASGRRPVDWVHVDDVVEAIIAAAEHVETRGETLDVGSARMTTVREVVESLRDLVDPSLTLNFGALSDRPLEGARRAEISRTEERIGWKPRMTLEAGLRETAEWFRRNRATADIEAPELAHKG